MQLGSWLSTLVFLPVFGLVMVVFDVAQRIARLFGQRPQEYVAGALQWALVHTFGICDTRLAVERSPNVLPWTSYIIVSNHQSMFDIPILGSLFFSNFPKYISKRSLGRWIPSVSYNLRRGGHVRNGGVSAMIFPEGTRARVGDLGPFKPAGTLALLEEAPHTPVVPVTIDNSWRLLQHNFFPVPWGVRVRVHIGAPIARHASEDRAALMARVRGDIADALERWREEAPAAACAVR